MFLRKRYTQSGKHFEDRAVSRAIARQTRRPGTCLVPLFPVWAKRGQQAGAKLQHTLRGKPYARGRQPFANRRSCMPGNAGWCGYNGRWKATAFLRPNPQMGKALGDVETGGAVTRPNPVES